MQQILSLSLQVQRALSTVEPESHFSFCPHGSIWGACVGAVHPLHAMETKSVGAPCLSYCSGDLRVSVHASTNCLPHKSEGIGAGEASSSEAKEVAVERLHSHSMPGRKVYFLYSL